MKSSGSIRKWSGHAVPTLLILVIAGCFSSGDSKFGGSQDISINVGSAGQNIVMSAGTTWSMVKSVSYDVKKFGGPFDTVSLNLADHLSAIAVTLPGQALMAKIFSVKPQAVNATSVSADMYLRIAPKEEAETVCESDNIYGPFSFMLDVDYQPVSVSPETATADQATVNIINTGSYSVCIQVLPPVDATVDLELLRLSVEGCKETPADIAGTWAGTYACVDNCGGESGDVELTITQNAGDPSVATYADSEAQYEGVVCGNRFTFKGGTVNYDESGTFTLNTDGTAGKSSTYRSKPPSICGGACTDTLVKAL